jgi:hypothetical protein
VRTYVENPDNDYCDFATKVFGDLFSTACDLITMNTCKLLAISPIFNQTL